MSASFRLKLSLFLNYFVFAILLNSVGTVILQVQRNYGVTESAASMLEACKDLSIAVVSFIVASCFTRLGYKRGMLLALAFITCVCLAMPSCPGFLMTKLLFIAIGCSFAVIKVGVFSCLGLIARDEKAHASLMSFLESFFMAGVLAAYFIFGAFIDDQHPESTAWLRVYYFLGAGSFAAFLLLVSTPLDESSVHGESGAKESHDFSAMIKLALTGLSVVFIISVFLYVLIEQGIMSWLPTFNSKVLFLPATLSVQMASILAASTAAGRFLAGWVLKKLPWFPVVIGCLVAAAALVLIALPMAKHSTGAAITGWHDAPLAAFIFPLIGFCIAPIYPVINSVILSALPPRQHSAMSGLIVVFSALGGTTGSIITAKIFHVWGGQTAFYASLVPITVLAISLSFFYRARRRHDSTSQGGTAIGSTKQAANLAV